MPFHGIEVDNLQDTFKKGGLGQPSAAAVNIDGHLGRSYIVLSEQFFPKEGIHALPMGTADGFKNALSKWDAKSKRMVARETPVGTPWHANSGRNGVTPHELGHTIGGMLNDLDHRAFESDDLIKKSFPNQTKAQLTKEYKKAISRGEWDKDAPFTEWLLEKYEAEFSSRFSDFVYFAWTSEGHMHLSEYSHTNPEEFIAEMASVALDPEFDRQTLHPATAKMIDDFEWLLKDMGVWKPQQPGRVAVQGADLQAAFADQFAKLVTERMHGAAIADHDVEAIVQYFSKWTQEVIGKGLETSHDWVGKLAQELAAGVPTDGAFAFNRTQALTHQLISGKIELAQRDAFRLAEMAPTRSVLERSVNHPVFGLYPSSYMWSKVFPQMARFIAKEPFGFQTSYGAYLMAQIEQSMAIQREYDPEFATAEKTLNASETLYMLDYATPSLPWSDFRAATAPWLQAANKHGLDTGAMFDAELATISPKRWVEMFAKPGTEIIEGIQGFNETPPPSSTQTTLESLAQPTGAPTPGGTAAPYTPGPTKGTDLGPVLVDEMTQLQQLLQ